MTKTEICNAALGVLGHDRVVTDLYGMTDGAYNDQSTEAERCRLFFSAALENTLGAHDWDFAAVEKPLTLTAVDDNGYARVPIIPDCLRIVRVTDAESHALKVRRTRDFLFVKVGSTHEAVIRYVSSDIDFSCIPPKFREALTYQLAALICGPMYGSDSKTEGYTNLAKLKLADAINAETDETSSPGEWENPFLAARR